MFKALNRMVDRIVAPMIHQDDSGRTIVYMHGLVGRGIVPRDDLHRAELIKLLKINVATVPLLTAFVIQLGLPAALTGCFVYSVAYAALVSWYSRKAKRTPVPIFQRSAALKFAMLTSPTLTVTNLVIALVFLLIGTIMFAAGNRFEGTLLVALFGAMTFLYGYMIYICAK